MTIDKLQVRHIINSLELNDSGDPVSTFEALRVGTIFDRGAVFTKDMLDAYVSNFKKKSYNGAEIQVNLNHQRGTEAAGWITNVFVENDSLMLTVAWTELGQEKIKKKLYKYVSVEVIDEMPHWKTGKPVKYVLGGLALTNDPALGGQKALELAKLLHYNTFNMDMFKKFLELLSSKSFVTSEEKTTLKDMFESLEDEQKEEVKEEVETVEAKPEEEEKEEDTTENEEEKDKEEEEDKEDPKTELSKSPEFVALSKEVSALKKEKEEYQRQLKAEKLSKKADELSFSKETKKGFVDAKEDLMTFMNDLTDAQVEQFMSLVDKYKTVDLSEFGYSHTPTDKDTYTSMKTKAEELMKEKGITFRKAMDELREEKN